MLPSKLPHVGTTIFTVMTNRAKELGAINLAQGFPDYDVPDKLKELVAYHVAAGRNQYAPMTGVGELREQIALKLAADYGRMPDHETEITITLGATEAIFSTVMALVHPGEEVILFDPAYDSYAPAVLLAGGRPIHIPLQPPHFRIDWQRVREAVTPKLRLIMINTPHNPTGSVLDPRELDTLADIVRPTQAFVLMDEVYEHMVFDAARHASLLAHTELYERGIAVFPLVSPCMRPAGVSATQWRRRALRPKFGVFISSIPSVSRLHCNMRLPTFSRPCRNTTPAWLSSISVSVINFSMP
jgi:methionine aminotransferase